MPRKKLGRPVKWTDERSSSFVSDNHGRDHEQTAELALDAEGHFLALRLTGFGNLGGYLGTMSPQPPTLNTVRNVISLYRTPLIEVSTKCVFTNTTFLNPYRGAGRPEGNYYMERLIDYAAAETGIDRIELRRKNQIRKSEIPYKSAAGTTYDSGDFPAILKQALEASDWKGFNKRKRESKKDGKLRGIGVGCYLEVTAPANKEMGGIRFDADGGVTILHRHARLRPGPRLAVRAGAEREARRAVREGAPAAGRQRRAAGRRRHRRLALDDELRHGDRRSRRQGDRARQADRLARARSLRRRHRVRGRQVRRRRHRPRDRHHGAGATRSAPALKLPADGPQSLDVKHVSEGAPAAYPNGCHVCEVEIDPDTGNVEIVKYTAVNDFGTIINPMLVDGQIHGGVVQGIGQALLEHVVYDDEGQLLSGSFMDYAMPRAHHVPDFEVFSHPVPAKTNPLGVKGCGEAGCAGSLTSIMNARGRRALGLRHQAHRHAGDPAAGLAGDPGRQSQGAMTQASNDQDFG